MKSGFLFQSFGSSPRWPSPRSRVSQRMTSAPNSQSTRATVGPAAPVVSSITRMPSRGNWLIESDSFGAMEYRSVGVMVYSEFAKTPSFQYPITPVFLDHSFGSERHEIVVIHAELIDINLLVMLAEQRSRAVD